MQTECTLPAADLEPHFRREITATFDANSISSDGGALLLRELEESIGLIAQMAVCFRDWRHPSYTEFSTEELLKQRIFGLVLGYEDVEDHDRLRGDPLLALAVGRRDFDGRSRAKSSRDEGKSLAGKSTLNRLERAVDTESADPRYHKFSVDHRALDRLLVETFITHRPSPPSRLIIDLDPSDIELHGSQEGRFFHGYYGHYCYLPHYYFIGSWPVGVRMRHAGGDAAAGCIKELTAIVDQLKDAWPDVDIIIRADSGFAREELMVWCERQGIDFVIGLAKNDRLRAMIEETMVKVVADVAACGEARRRFEDLTYKTLKSWTRKRRVVAKVEALPGKENPRFVVTSLSSDALRACPLYEHIYCGRGRMENHIKEQQLDLFGTRMSTSRMTSNQLRMYLSAFAHLFVVLLRDRALSHTAQARWTARTIRERLLKVAVVVRVSARRIHLAISRAFPLAAEFRRTAMRLRAPP